MRNVEVLRDKYLGGDPSVETTLSGNSLRLIGIRGELFALKTDVDITVEKLRQYVVEQDGELSVDIGNLETALNAHKNNALIHLSEAQRDKIAASVTSSELATALLEVLNDAKAYTDSQISHVVVDVDQITQQEVNDTVDSIWNPSGGTEEASEIIEQITTDPIKVINPEDFYRFKNMVDNSSFEVFDGITLVPYGWDNGKVSADAAMFGTRSLKLEPGDTAKQTEKHCADVTWSYEAYNTTDLILSFYHKFGGCTVSVYDIENGYYMHLQPLDSNLQEEGETTLVVAYPYKANWNKYRNYIKITPEATTRKIRIEFTCPQSANSEVYIDAVSLEPFVENEYPSIYKDGRYSLAAYQLLNPNPYDVDRYTNMEHFNIANSVADADGNLTYQELLKQDGSLAMTRQASNPDANGYYQTVVETFYKADGTVNYVDTYSYTFSSAGAIMTRSFTTTEVQ